jgi:hypothetical protein
MAREGIVPKTLKTKMFIAGRRNVTRKISIRNPGKISARIGSIAEGKESMRTPQR